MLYELIDTIISSYEHIDIFRALFSIGLMGLVFLILILLYKMTHNLLIDNFLLLDFFEKRKNTFKVPKNFSLNSDNIKNSLKFISGIKSSKSKNIIIDFNKNKTYNIHSYIVLYAILEDLKSKKVNIKILSNKNHKAFELFHKIKYNKNTNENNLFIYKKNNIQIDVAKESIDILKKIEYDDKYEPLYKILIEIMENSCHHYIYSSTKNNSSYWWYIIYYSTKNNTISYSFFDFGPGIIYTYKKNIHEWGNITLSLLITSYIIEDIWIKYSKNIPTKKIDYLFNSKIIIQKIIFHFIIFKTITFDVEDLNNALVGKLCSTTNMGNRGLGLPAVFEKVQQNAISSFRMLSTNIYLKYHKNKIDQKIFQEDCRFYGTYYYWEINKQNLNHGNNRIFNR
nr:hypothetical protein [Parabacteroides goldsteinii]